MSQNNVDFSGNPTGAGLMDDYLDKEQQNVLTSNSGIQRPSYAIAGTKWIDTSVTPWILKMYDGTDDVVIGTVDPSTHKFVASIPLTTTGDLIVQNENGKPDRLASGTAGTVLTSNGVGQIPSWQKSPYQTIDNLSQTIDDSTEKYPSNAAVKTAVDKSSRVTNVVSSFPNHVNVVTDVETRTDIYYGWTVEGSGGVQDPLYTTTETLVEGTFLYTGAADQKLFVVESVEAVDDYFMVTVDLGPLFKFTRNTDYDTSYSYNVKSIKLKAGSRVHFPNGNYVDIAEDKSVEYPWAGTGDYYLYTSGENNNLRWVPVAYTFTDNVQRSHISGGDYLYGLWYDTDTNVLKETQDNRQHWNDNNVSLPACIFRYQTNNPQIYIKKVFKDYGHLAGLLFALPGINGKTPNGKNPDGTIKTIDYTLPTVSTLLVGNTSTDTGVTASSDVALSADGSLVADTFTLKDDNYLYNSSDALVSGFECCSYSVSDGRVTSLEIKQPYKLYDSDKIDEKFVHKALDEVITGAKSFDNEVIFARNVTNTSSGQTRVLSPKRDYGVITRVDDTDYYILLTNRNDAYGTWNGLRPFHIDLATGQVSIKTPKAPNYTGGTGITWNSVYTVPSDGVIRVGGQARDNSYIYLKYNSTSGPILWQHGDYGGATWAFGCVPVSKGTKIIGYGGATGQTLTFFPYNLN